jgi:uncharacterized protein (TIGR02217 family)
MSDTFLESPPFPGCPSFGYTVNPKYSTTISSLPSGKEFRNRNWARPLIEIEVTVGPRVQDEIEDLLEFWHAVGGQELGFRFKDESDYKSCRLSNDPLPTDQPFSIVAGSPGGYQLIKRYTAGIRTQLRYISKPVNGTIRVANELGAEQPSSRWSIDYTNGLLTPNGGFVGTPSAWGGEFDVPVRFNSEFPVQLMDHEIQSVTFTLLELRAQVEST